jgi:HSP20 family protein
MSWRSPWDELEALRRDLDRALGLETGRRSSTPRVAFLPGRSARAYPLTNVSEDADNVYVQALAPGLDTDKLELTVLGNTLTISGVKKGNPDVKPEAYHRSERAAGRFVRSIELPTEVDNDKVSARYANGLLTITLPRAAAARPKQVQVTLG